MKANELIDAGIPKGDALSIAMELMIDALKSGAEKDAFKQELEAVANAPENYTGDDHYGELARAIVAHQKAVEADAPRDEPVAYKVFGGNLEEKSLEQMINACRLPVSVVGALMPDAHAGYGLPIGGVLATDGAVIPYAVGVDIACRMKMSVLDLPVDAIEDQKERLVNSIERETEFGAGAFFKVKKEHAVMDDDWSVSPVTQQNKDKAWKQLGTSGGGNHFVEYGTLTVDVPGLGLEPGVYLALLSHSGSRGTGHKVASYYSDIARELHPGLPGELSHLAWLDMDSHAGQEYWAAMELMGRYASANHDLIHRYIARNLGVDVILDIENHHNFAWKENHGGRDLVVHRKGATPATKGVLGIIPGSMATPGYVVRGRGSADSICSASHGAGRLMSRTQAKATLSWETAREFLTARGVHLISGGLDEVPMAYKDIEEVMAAQAGLVDILARFDPKIVKMEKGKGRKRRRSKKK